MNLRNHSFKASRVHRGRTLIELMVTIALGLLLSAIILSIYMSLRQNTRIVDANALLQDTARFAQQIIARQVRHAGYVSYVNGGSSNLTLTSWTDTPSKPQYVYGCVGTISSALTATTGTCVGGTEDVLQVAAGGESSISYDAASGEGGDCLGQAPGAAFNINRFYVAVNATTGNRELYCLGSGNGTPQPVASGIEQLVIWYGRASNSDSTRSATRWDRASVVEAANGWADVVATRICLIAASDQNGVVTSTTAYKYTDCFGVDRTGSPFAANPNAASTDGKARRAYWMTITLRNFENAPFGLLQKSAGS